MALFLVSRTDGGGYDEYDAIVVRAGDEATALKIATNGKQREKLDGSFWDPDFPGFERDGSNLTVEKLASRGPQDVLITSYNAG
ncbi:hypothetical protein [Streptomyces silvensis]|uniref:Uncharacterized protein n=1 Tax=Streptomyces silvensis TaxID=1765722 RepID=A0A0W7X7K7_9ACTN|nr:hypothetical protein [Streptomyces silvensis]KUF18840.1 hypothetical protein AT728_07340 [Streptomyces silvensis]